MLHTCTFPLCSTILNIMKKQNTEIRTTDKSEFYQTNHLTREAFWNLYQSGCDEHLVLHQLRKSTSYVEELDLLGIYENEIIGHIISTKAQVIDYQNNTHEVLCVGPISVLPSLQGKGIGSDLLNRSIAEAKKMGFKGMILFGNPDYYHRFGFKNAKEYEISTKDNQNFEPFMALELYKGSLKSSRGKFFEDKAFETKLEDVNEFDKNFPRKEKGKPKVDISKLK